MRTPSAPEGKRTLWCLTDPDFACYVDGVLSGWRRRRAQRHLAGCERCRNELSLLVRSERLPLQSPPPEWIARVRQVAQKEHRFANRGWQWKMAGATLACSMAAIGWFVARPHQAPIAMAHNTAPAVSSATGSTGDDSSAVRKLGKATDEPVVLAPATGSTVAQDLVAQWQPVPGAVSYDIAVLNADGDILWRATTKAEAFRVPSTALSNGAEYFVTISAKLSSGKTVRAKAVPFWVQRR